MLREHDDDAEFEDDEDGEEEFVDGTPAPKLKAVTQVCSHNFFYHLSNLYDASSPNNSCHSIQSAAPASLAARSSTLARLFRRQIEQEPVDAHSRRQNSLVFNASNAKYAPLFSVLVIAATD